MTIVPRRLRRTKENVPTNADVVDGNLVIRRYDGSELEFEGGQSGTSVPGTPIVRAFPFAFDSPGISSPSGAIAGFAIYTPTIGDVLLDAWFQINTGWDGTTPKIDIGQFIDSNVYGWYAEMNTAPPATFAWSPNDHGVLQPTVAGLLLSISALYIDGNGLVTTAGAPMLIRAADPVKVVVSQTGQVDGDDPGSTHGSGVVYLVTATPAT